MALTLYYHPLSNYCQKVLIALEENQTGVERRQVDLSDPVGSAEFFALSPMGKIPALRDNKNNRVLIETTIIMEYLDQHYPGAVRLIPADPELALQTRLWDRLYDNYLSTPMQKIVGDRLRPSGQSDAHGVEEAKATLQKAYAMMNAQAAKHRWAVGDAFTMADCTAAPNLFYAEAVLPFSQTHKHLAAYFDRLAERPSFKRVLEAARPYFHFFPLHDKIPARFL